MATSQFGTVVQAVAATVVAATIGYRLKGDTASGKTVTVYRGPEASSSSDPGDWLAVGWGGDGETAGTWSQSTGPLAATAGRPRDETGEITCLASVQTGNLDVTDSIDRCEAIVAAVEAKLRADPTVGLVPPLQRLVVEMRGAGSVRWVTGSRGQRCEITFTLGYRARI